MLVKEFIVNISKECDNKRSKEFRKVYARGRCVDFSLEIINRFLGRNEEEQAEVEVSDNVICREITSKQVKEWPRKGNLSASYLSVKYAVLHRIRAANWHVVSFVVKMPIAFPSLICSVILSQHPSILISSNSICKREPHISLHYMLFTVKYVPNIIVTSGQKSSRLTTRTCILDDLKDACLTLDETIKIYTERKSRLEILIKSLFEEEVNFKGDEAGEEDANEEGTDASDDKETTSSDED
ncbi:uncharacterized protein LOC127096287 [Lathyrus oleraceus]|uniref:uncharacterized protein LOC127096287 n=1 Tax=Pisum sativum TaxID=3888 RepID=UPI0021D190C1|nr:uncharacterized protein LOC127096287 [Pisum sativum]